MRILLWHGYLLEGTGSNVYTRAVAREWQRAGHDVVVFCQDRRPGRVDLGGAEVVRPDLPDGLLPVFVLDRYEELEPRLLQELTTVQRARLGLRPGQALSLGAQPENLHIFDTATGARIP